jgi:plastocyanin
VSLPAPPLRRLLPAAGVIAALGVAACGGSDSDSGSSSPASTQPATQPATQAGTAPAGASKVALSAAADGSLAFNTTKLSSKAGSVTMMMTNPSSSGTAHGIALSGSGVSESGQVVDPGSTSTLTANLKPGSYTFLCPVPGHEAAGMKGTLTVR